MKRHLQLDPRDVLHTHGLWMMPNVYPSKAARRLGASLVLSPRGMLGKGALQFSRAKKRAFWWAVQKSAMKSVDCFHATAKSELEDIREFGLQHPVAVIPNGIDLPDLGALQNERKPAEVHTFLWGVFIRKRDWTD